MNNYGCRFPFEADRHDSSAVSRWLPKLGACKICTQAIRAALANPVKNLKNE